MKISQLKYFTSLAELQNVSKAAEILHLSQSSLSKNISSIESEIGVELFDRNGKHISLNAAGQRFLKTCNAIISEYENAVGDIKVMSTGEENRIKIGACGNLSKLLPVMTEFKKNYPQTEFDVNAQIDSEASIDINDYDLLIFPDEPKYNKFGGYDLFEEIHYLGVNKSHSLAKQMGISAKSLNGQDVVFMRTNKVNEFAYYVSTALSVQYQSINYVTSRPLHVETIASGLAIGFVPEGYKDFYSSNEQIKLIPITDNNFKRNYKICFKRKKHLGKLAIEFENFVANKYRWQNYEY